MNRTKIRKIGNKSYCIYCAKPSKRDSDGSNHNNDYVEFDVCNCLGSKKAISIKQQIDDLWVDIEDLPKIHKYKLDKMQYDIDVAILREKWGIEIQSNETIYEVEKDKTRIQ